MVFTRITMVLVWHLRHEHATEQAIRVSTVQVVARVVVSCANKDTQRTSKEGIERKAAWEVGFRY